MTKRFDVREHHKNVRYQELHDTIFDWIDEGLFEFAGERSTNKFTELDEYILAVFGYQCSSHYGGKSYTITARALNSAIDNGTLNIDWLRGPYGLALWKALLIKRGRL